MLGTLGGATDAAAEELDGGRGLLRRECDAGRPLKLGWRVRESRELLPLDVYRKASCWKVEDLEFMGQTRSFVCFIKNGFC